MSKKTIVLADNSYTIRRIVELSFSEESDIELVTFENSNNLKEKLLELKPHVILADIKLPEFSGYDVCKFVQETDSLSHTKVFLLKGGFDPIDEGLQKGLKYVDIITKPFDSNALVSSVKKLLTEMSAQPQASAVPMTATEEIPSSLPEDFAEVDGVHSVGDDISFSDVKEEIETDGILSPDDFGRTPAPYADDEVLPSDEVTRAQPEKDTIDPTIDEGDDNPFAEELPPARDKLGSLTEEELNIKRNIEMQEKELEIGSLTLEEISIKKDIEDRQRLIPEEGDAMPDFDNINEEPESQFSPGPLPDMPEAPDEIDLPPEIGEEPVTAADHRPSTDMDDDELFAFSRERMEESPPDTVDEELFAAPPHSRTPLVEDEPEPEPQLPQEEPLGIPDLDADPSEAFTTRKLEMADIRTGPDPMEITDYDSLRVEVAPEPQPPLEMADDMRIGFDDEFDSVPGEEPPTEFEAGEEYEVPPIDTAASMQEFQAGESSPGYDDEPVYEIPRAEPETESQLEDESEPQSESDDELEPELEAAVPEIPDEFEPVAGPEPEPEPEYEDEVEPEPVAAAPEIPAAPQAAAAPANAAGISQEDLMRTAEGRLTNAVKEMLWEIVPPLAEKIIRKEIEALKAQAEKAED